MWKTVKYVKEKSFQTCPFKVTIISVLMYIYKDKKLKGLLKMFFQSLKSNSYVVLYLLFT